MEWIIIVIAVFSLINKLADNNAKKAQNTSRTAPNVSPYKPSTSHNPMKNSPQNLLSDFLDQLTEKEMEDENEDQERYNYFDQPKNEECEIELELEARRGEDRFDKPMDIKPSTFPKKIESKTRSHLFNGLDDYRRGVVMMELLSKPKSRMSQRR